MPRGGGRAGDYWEKCKLHTRTVETDEDTGFKRPTWTAGGILWCYSADVKAEKKLAYGIMNSEIETEIHIRGYPTIDAKDRLELMTTGFLYDLKGFYYDYNTGETVVVGKRTPTLENT